MLDDGLVKGIPKPLRDQNSGAAWVRRTSESWEDPKVPKKLKESDCTVFQSLHAKHHMIYHNRRSASKLDPEGFHILNVIQSA